MTAVYTFRMIFRAFHGEPVPEALRARGRAHRPPRRPDEPGDGRGRGHRGRLPGRGSPHRRARGLDEGRHGRAGRRRHAARRSCRSPASPRSCTSSSSRPSRTRRFYASSSRRTGAAWIGLIVGAVDRAGRHRARLPPVGPATAARRPHPGAPAAAAHVLLEQVVLRRADRLRDRAAVRLVRPLRAQHVRAPDRRRRAGRRDHRRRPAPAPPRCARCSPASCAPTRRCCCSASPALGLYFLITAYVTIHLSILLFAPLALALRRRVLPPAARPSSRRSPAR